MPKKPKNIKSAFSIASFPTKTPREEAGPDLKTLRPAWRISRLEMCDPFGWHLIEKEKLLEIHSKLSELEALDWNEILVKRSHWNHPIEVWKLEKVARDRLKALRLDDYEELISIRLSGPERIWGIRHLGELTLLWWDPNHKVYRVNLSHT